MELINAYQEKIRKTNTHSMKMYMRFNKEKNCYEYYEPPKPIELIGAYKYRYLTPQWMKMIVA